MTTIIKDSNNPNYRLINNFLEEKDCISIIEDANKSGEDLWMIDFEKHYPKQEDVSPDYWTGIKDWQGMSLNLDMPNCYEIYNLNKDKYEKILNDAKKQIEERFQVKVVREQFLISRWREGREQTPHVDYIIDEEDNNIEDLYGAGMNDAFIEQFKKNYRTKHYSTIIYLNDDFEGGELYFTQYDNATVVPSTGMMICFKGDTHHLHGVKKVTKGIRYTISIFWMEI
jgi:hypothetical protein